MPDPNPVRPRVKDYQQLERALRRTYLDPMFARLRERLAAVEAAAAALEQVRQVIDDMLRLPLNGVPLDQVVDGMNRIDEYHRQRLIATFRAALGVDIRPFLTGPHVAQVMAQRIAENVALISTLPERTQAGLQKRIQEAFEEAPFDQERLRRILRDEYGVEGYNLRRITRDQTNKAIGQLTQLRQQQVGVQQYQWLTSQDERVRPTHVSKSGRLFRWDDPPADTGHPGHDVQCRCVARPVITAADRERLGAARGPSSIVAA